METRRFKRLLAALLVGSVVVLGAGTALAQGRPGEPGPFGPGSQAGTGGMMGPGDGRGMMGPRGGMMGPGGAASTNRATFVAQHFIQEMIPHHEDAVVMADLALVQAEHPELRDLAATIKRVQSEEIGSMREWYQAWWGAPVPPSMMGGGMMGRMGGMGGHDPTSIDGARPFDKAFIEEMIPHHEMAVHMATMALGSVEQPELRTLLQSIITSQRAEIAQMRAWYADWYGQARAPGRGMGRH
jgi:uncharacterized protein (DUF305 family)